MAMKFRAHDTFFIRKGWLSKGMRNVVANPDVFVTKDKDRNPMDILGIGANMVKALRYWLQVVGLTAEASKGQRVQSLTALGEFITLPFPVNTIATQNSTIIDSTKGLIKRELIRMMDFADIAENPSSTFDLVYDLKHGFNISEEELLGEEDSDNVI